MSLKSSTFRTSVHHRVPISTESHMVRGGNGGHNNPRKRTYVSDLEDDVEPEIDGSHELPNTDHTQVQSPAVNGSGERRHILLNRVRSGTSKVAQPNVTSTTTTGGSEIVSQKDAVIQRHQLSTAKKDDWSYRDSENSDDRAPTLARDLSKSNRKQVARRSSQHQQGDHDIVAGGPRFDKYASGEHSETSDASETSDPLSDASSTQSEESSSDSDSKDDEASTRDVWSENVSKPSHLVTNQKPFALTPKRIVYYRIHPSASTEAAFEAKQQLQAYLPDAVVSLESTSLKTPYSDREVLNRLLSQIVDGQISEILVADSNHISATKDGFNVFAWICHRLGAKVFILPALQSV